MATQANKGCKVSGAHMATGYWGRDAHIQVFAAQEQARQRALLTDQILTGGIKASLWQGSTEGTKCNCYKESNTTADRRCGACHGKGYLPGYEKFGYNTLYMTGMDSDVTLTNVEETGFKSSKYVISEGETTGTIVSGDKTFSRTAFGSVWESQALYFLREPTQSNVVVTYSLDHGVTWKLLAQLAVDNPASGTIRFKAVLTRDDTNVLSPFFEIVRARYSTIGLERLQLDGQYRTGPWVLIMRNPPSTGHRKYEYGQAPIEDGLTMWTAGLGFFDPSIEMGSQDELIKGPDVLMEILEGARIGNKYVAINWQNSDPIGYILVSQTFKIRIEDPVGPFATVW